MSKIHVLLPLCALALVACKKHDDGEPCAAHPVPALGMQPWSVGQDASAVDTVAFNQIHVGFHAVGCVSPTMICALSHINVRLSVTATDSLLFEEGARSNNGAYDFDRNIQLNSVTAPIPATLSINVVNSCGNGIVEQRSLYIQP